MIRLFILTLLTGTLLQAENHWPQFRGPGGLGIGTGDPPVEFGPDQNQRWRVPVPAGHSSPILWGDKIFLTGLEQDRLVTLCLSRLDGSELWRAAAPAETIEGTHRIGSPAAPTPCTDGERLHVYFGSFGVLTYDLDGRELWRKALPLPLVEFGTSSSPILADGKVIIQCDQDMDSYLLALDARTGEEVWRVNRPEFRRGFATPFVWRHDGNEELVVAGSLSVRGYDLKDGRQKWNAHGMARVANATPIAVDDLLIVSSWNVGGDEGDRITLPPIAEFAAEHDANKDGFLALEEFPEGPLKGRFSQFDADKDGVVSPEEFEQMRAMFDRAENQIFAIRAGGEGDITESHVVWRSNKHLPYISSPMVVNDRVFTMKSGGIASCYDARSGSPVFQAERVEASGDYYSSAVSAADRLYLISQRGTAVVLDAAADQLKVLARNDLREPVFASPALVDGVLYVRTEKHLCAFAR